MANCEDCNRSYTDGGFAELIIPYWAWKQISTHGDETGLLCPSCLCARLTVKGITCPGAFMGGPVRSVSADTMEALRGIENIELALEGRMNQSGIQLRDRIKETVYEG